MDVTSDAADPARASWVVTDILDTDRSEWETLFRGYGDFYEVPMPQAKLDTVWQWIHDDRHEVRGLVVRSSINSAPVGLAHYRPFARPLHGSTGCYLDDLFVSPSARGTGAVDALVAALQHRAHSAG